MRAIRPLALVLLLGCSAVEPVERYHSPADAAEAFCDTSHRRESRETFGERWDLTSAYLEANDLEVPFMVELTKLIRARCDGTYGVETWCKRPGAAAWWGLDEPCGRDT